MNEHIPTLENPFPYPISDDKLTTVPEYWNTIFGTVDLNHPSTYEGSPWRDFTNMELWIEIWGTLGKSIVYMLYIRPDGHDKQYERVHAMGRAFGMIPNDFRFNDNPQTRMYLMKFLYRLEMEVENQC